MVNVPLWHTQVDLDENMTRPSPFAFLHACVLQACRVFNSSSLSPTSGVLAALHSRLDGSFHVEKRERPGQFFHSVPDGAGRPFWYRLPGAQLPLPLGHRGPGQ